MKLVSVEEFQKLIGLSDKAIVWLLNRNMLPCQILPERGVCIDIESVDTAILREAILARRDTLLRQHNEVVVEKLGNVVRDELESIVDEAIGHYLAEEGS